MISLRRHQTGDKQGERGTALLELALVLPMLLTILLFVAELGFLIHSRLIVTNVSREGGSLGSRAITLDNRFLTLLESAGKPLNLAGDDGKVIVTRITSGTTDQDPLPRVTTRLSDGRLVVQSMVNGNQPKMGLPAPIYDHLVYRTANGTADIAEVTIVEIFYKHRPVTPLQRFMRDLVLADGDGTILKSRAIF